MKMDGFLEILRQTLKIFLKNGKLIPIVTVLYVLANSLILLSYLFTNQLIVNNFTEGVATLTPDGSYYQNMMSLLKQEVRLLFLANSVLFFSASAVQLLFAAVTISASADENLPAKEVVSIALRSWKRTLLTWFHVALLVFGYAVFVVVLFVLPLDPIFLDPASLMLGKVAPSTVIIAVLAAIMYFYMSVVWTLAIMVAVLEERSGFEALWRASVLVRGLKWKGFLLKLLFGGLYSGVLLVSKAIFGWKLAGQATSGVGILVTVVLGAISAVLAVLSVISFTVLYLQGKKMNHADQYSAVVASDIP